MEFNKRYNRSEFVNFLQHKFLPEDFIAETTVVDIERQTKYIRSVTKLGSSESLDLVVYEIRHTSTHDARVGLSKEAFRFLADEWESKALVLFVPEVNDVNYRFSLITIDLNETEEGKLQKIYSNPRRYSYYLGEGIAFYTPNKYLNAGRVTDEKDLTDRFSVEVLTKAFYQELSDWYAWAVKIVRFPNKLDDKNDDDKYNSEAAIRLVTRLIFVWFLKQKHLIPNEFFDEDYIRENLIDGFNPNVMVDLFSKSNESKYYKAILQNLFFAMLNSPITKEGESELSERHFRSGRGDYDNNKLMRYESMFKNPQLFIDLANKTVPFLNGGLFDCLDDKDNGNYIDGFSDREVVKKALIVPDYLFFGEEVGKDIDLSEWYGDKKKKRVSARGIIDIFKRYNFTVEENTPFDQEVSLDPELLGKVFENLLASYNPETQTTARKQTGSFYTPRDIVQYMVDESLVAHLNRTVGEDLELEFRKLISYVDEEISLTTEQKLQVMESIYHCKVLGPACGSGAFPVGVLQQMVHILSQLDPTNEQWKKMMLDEAVNESRDAFQAESKEEREERLLDIENSFDENLNNPDYARKLYLIENCIYGVDIQPIAIQISKLRFFISLVVDQKTNNDPTKNFGIRPLPNLEAKFVAANSLIPLAKHEANIGRTEEIIALETKLKEANHKIFSAKTVRTKRKWKERLIELRTEMAEKLADNGFLTADAANQLTSWDMFNQNASSPFFDSEWMFGVKDKFDVVIANPPYVEAKKLKYIASTLRTIYPDVYTGTSDFSVYFISLGLKLLKEDGILSYITTNKFFNTGYGKKVRELLLSKDIENLINFEQVEVFENVLVSSVILGVINRSHNINKEFTYERFYKLKANEFRSEFVDKRGYFGTYPCKFLDENEWSFPDITKILLKHKIESETTQLSEIKGVNIYRGVTTGYNPAFIINNDQRDRFIEADCNNINIIKNMLQGRNIRRWYYNESDENLLFIPWHFPLHDDNTISGSSDAAEMAFEKTYNILYSWLLSHKTELLERNQEETGIRYEWYALQRCAASYYREFEQPEKIIWGLTADKWAFTLDKEQHYLPSNGYILTSSCVPIRYILAMLNSKLMHFYFGYIGVMTAGGAYTLKAATISALPFKLAKNMDVLAGIADDILDIKYRDHNADVSDKEKQIDLFVYHLYELTYDEVLIVDPDTPITREEYEQM